MRDEWTTGFVAADANVVVSYQKQSFTKLATTLLEQRFDVSFLPFLVGMRPTSCPELADRLDNKAIGSLDKKSIMSQVLAQLKQDQVKCQPTK